MFNNIQKLAKAKLQGSIEAVLWIEELVEMKFGDCWRISAFVLLTAQSTSLLTVQASESLNKQTINLSDLKKTCKTSPYDCLKRLDIILDKAPANSRLFFNLLQYRFDSLFNLQQRHQLYQETKRWLDKKDLPLAFKTTVNIYYAKAAWFVGNRESSKQAYQVAKDSLAMMNQAYPSPMRLVIFANLQMQLNEYQQAYDLLKDLEQKYHKSPDESFMMELTGNLGHAANQLGNLEESLNYWQKALEWGTLLGNQQQQAVILYNIADINFKLNNISQAEQFLARTIEIAQLAKDNKKSTEAQFYLVKTKMKSNDLCGATRLYRGINLAQLPVKHHLEYQQFQQRLVDC
ncbi:tetratricopeptide repeat protein [Thalassotalea ganghwensis]